LSKAMSEKRSGSGAGGTPHPPCKLDNNYISREAPPDPPETSPPPVPRRRAGAKPGNRNALRHGRYTVERRAWRARMYAILKGAKTALEQTREPNHDTPQPAGS
jgi:hypothetical protein